MYKFFLKVILIQITIICVIGKDICTEISSSSKTNSDWQEKNEVPKLCRYRDEGLIPYDIWKYRTGAGCYSFFPPQWFSNPIRMVGMTLLTGKYNCTFPIGMVDKKPMLFDYTNANYSNIISSSFRSPNYFFKWQNCAIMADMCCNVTMTEDNVYPNNEYQCPATWDAWSCFKSAKNDSISELPCPDYTSSSAVMPCTLYSQKECFPNGTWNQQTDYGPCATAPVYRRRHNFHVIVLYVSIALSVPAIFIFLIYKNLRILRVILHRNLLIACILRNILTLITKELVILDSLKSSAESNNVLNNNGVACRVLAYFNSVAVNAIYACMLVDGYYLHKLIVRIFNRDPNIYILYAVTTVLSFLPTTIWAIVVAMKSNQYCWVVDSSGYQWIPDGFRIGILVINVLLLADIIRVLVMKLRRNVSAQHTKYTYILINGMTYNAILTTAFTSTLKATLFLIPLFGVPFIITANRGIVDSSSCTAGDIFYYISYAIQALQGVTVALLFCYWNKEVHKQIKGSFNTFRLFYNDRFGSKKPSNSNFRRETAATYVPHNTVASSHSPVDENPVENVDKKVNSWLTEHKFEASVPDDQVQCFSQEESLRSSYFGGISTFIDDSNENLQDIRK